LRQPFFAAAGFGFAAAFVFAAGLAATGLADFAAG
jgi:hypothetical protein